MNQDSLFDDIERADLDSRLNAEPHFSYLNRSNRLSVGRVRTLVDSWYQDFPDPKRDVRKRFRSPDEMHYLGAFTELFVAAVLNIQGFNLGIHEYVSPKGKSIDFQVEEGGRPIFLIESAASGDTDDAVWESSLLRDFYDGLNRLEHPDFSVMVRIDRQGTSSPSSRRARSFLMENFELLNWESLWAAMESGDRLSTVEWMWQDGEWAFSFTPIPRPPELRGVPDFSMVSAQIGRARSSQIGAPWLRRLTQKAGKYGQPELPYVIAVNGVGMFHRMKTVADALFGSTAVTIDRNSLKATRTRIPNGLWFDSGGPRYTRVSAVLFIKHLTPWSVAATEMELWLNPWAQNEFNPEWWQGSKRVSSEEEMTPIAGRSVADIFGLDANWPGDD